MMYALRIVSVSTLIALTACSDPSEILGSASGNEFVFSAARVPSSWRTGSALPTAVRAAAGASDGSTVYVFAGATASGSTKLTQIYDTRRDTWSNGATMPYTTDFAMAAAMRDGIHVLGGPFIRDHYVYDPNSDSWSARALMNTGVDAAVAVVVRDKLYVIGGATASATPTSLVQVYDPATDQWTLGAPMPTARLSAAGAYVRGMILVAGGQTAGIGTTDVLEAYDPDTDTWTALASMPGPREALGGAATGNTFCVFGGRLANANPTGNAFPDTFCYDPNKDTWTRGPDMTTPRVEVATAVVGNRIYAIGGRTPASIVVGTVESMK